MSNFTRRAHRDAHLTNLSVLASKRRPDNDICDLRTSKDSPDAIDAVEGNNLQFMLGLAAQGRFARWRATTPATISGAPAGLRSFAAMRPRNVAVQMRPHSSDWFARMRHAPRISHASSFWDNGPSVRNERQSQRLYSLRTLLTGGGTVLLDEALKSAAVDPGMRACTQMHIRRDRIAPFCSPGRIALLCRAITAAITTSPMSRRECSPTPSGGLAAGSPQDEWPDLDLVHRCAALGGDARIPASDGTGPGRRDFRSGTLFDLGKLIRSRPNLANDWPRGRVDLVAALHSGRLAGQGGTAVRSCRRPGSPRSRAAVRA